MELSAKKSNAMIITRKPNYVNAKPKLSIGGHNIGTVTQYKYLGLHLQNDLTWDIQFEETKRKVERQTNLLSTHVHHYLSPSPSIIARIAKATINPIMQYGLPFWQLTAKQLNTLDSAQRSIFLKSLRLHFTASRVDTRHELVLPDSKTLQQYTTLQLLRRTRHLPDDHPASETVKLIFQQPIIPSRLKRLETMKMRFTESLSDWKLEDTDLLQLTNSHLNRLMKQKTIPSYSHLTHLRKEEDKNNILPRYLDLPPKQASIIYKMRTDNIFNSKASHRHSGQDTTCRYPACNAMGIQESVKHVLEDCPMHNTLRRNAQQQSLQSGFQLDFNTMLGVLSNIPKKKQETAIHLIGEYAERVSNLRP